MRAAIYLRCTTGQTTENQRFELERVAKPLGWQIVGVHENAGIGGAKGRDKRPEFDRLLNDATRGNFDIVAAWSVDRLGRSGLRSKLWHDVGTPLDKASGVEG